MRKDNSESTKREFTKKGDIMLLNNESEQHRWSMAKMFATNEVNNGVLTLIHGASNKFDSVV